MLKYACFLLLLFFVQPSIAQQYDLVLKNGHVIDPKNRINEKMDIAIAKGRIAAVRKGIPASESKAVVDVTGLLVTPGLIDMHAHVFAGTVSDGDLSYGFGSLPADGFTFRVGVTTVVDAGSSGAKDFHVFKANIADRSRTRVLAFLNVGYEGMKGSEYSEYQQDAKYMDPKMAADTAKKYKDHIVGVKVAHYHQPTFLAVERAVEAGVLSRLPVMVDFGGCKPRLPLKTLLLDKMRPGDIFTHVYGELLDTKESIVDTARKALKPFVLEGRKRGIIYDVGHGGGSFRYSQAIPATKAGLFPDVISTDLHTGSMNAGMKDQLNVMSKFMALGMPLKDVIKASTWRPAEVINHLELGHLSEGAVADIAVLRVEKGKFGFFDVARDKQIGNQKLTCELTLKDGAVVYDLNAISIP
ncbi:amidohydrolase/deacetylase family metallohydrolase [Ravibacter arvi]|uniref:Amidohydrolase/deacetylase family metallohydrolase n=1 Tax=Ravibacter arvi TaxID=2051041 RepID=A0ABP8LPS0_9BACT